MDGEQIGDVGLLPRPAAIDADVPNLVEDASFDRDECLLEQVVRNARLEEGRESSFAKVRLDGSTNVDHLPRGGADDSHALIRGREVLLISTRDEVVSRQFGLRHAKTVRPKGIDGTASSSSSSSSAKSTGDEMTRTAGMMNWTLPVPRS